MTDPDRHAGTAARPLRLALELSGAGGHPAARRALGAAGVDPAHLLTLGFARDVAVAAEAAGFDLLVLDDSLAPGGESPEALLSGRLDALTVAAALGPLTRTIGLAPVVTTTHTEPFHVAKNLQSLDWVSRGRAAWKPAVSVTAAEARAFGRKDPAQLADRAELWAEAADVVEVARRLWDSWEDEAIIRHAPTGRFVDRTKLHYIDFAGDRFSVRGPSITPRSPQAQPPILIELDDAAPATAWRLAAREADLVVLRGADPDAVRVLRADLDRLLATEPRSGPAPAVLAALDVVLDTAEATAAERLRALHASAEAAGLALPATGAAAHVGSGAELAATFSRWRAAVDLDGFLLRPAVAPVDLAAFAATVTPLLPHPAPSPVTPDTDPPATLRDRFGWPRPANRYTFHSTTASPTDSTPTATAATTTTTLKAPVR